MSARTPRKRTRSATSEVSGPRFQFAAKRAIAGEEEIHIGPVLCDEGKGIQQGCVVLHRMKAGNGNEIAADGIQAKCAQQSRAVGNRAVAFNFNAIFDDLDSPTGEAVYATQGTGTEARNRR